MNYSLVHHISFKNTRAKNFKTYFEYVNNMTKILEFNFFLNLRIYFAVKICLAKDIIKGLFD